MRINGKEYEIDKIIEPINIDKNIPMKRKNGLVLRETQIETLNKYHIDYERFNTLTALINEIEEMLIEDDEEELETLSMELQEMNYYNYTHK